MGLFRRRTEIDPAALDRMRSEITSLRDAIKAHDARREAESAASAADPRPDPHDRLDALTSTLTDLQQRAATEREVPDHGPRIDELAAQLAALDARVTAVSTELTNQITELGHDIDALADLPSNERATLDASVLIELRDSQSRLANEQARYQIAFREDLARIAEQFRRPAK